MATIRRNRSNSGDKTGGARLPYRGGVAPWRYALAWLLTVVLVFQSMFGSGVASAFAETLSNQQELSLSASENSGSQDETSSGNELGGESAGGETGGGQGSASGDTSSDAGTGQESGETQQDPAGTSGETEQGETPGSDDSETGEQGSSGEGQGDQPEQGEDETNPSDASTEDASTPQDDEGQADEGIALASVSEPQTKAEFTDNSGSASFTTSWADNNYASRPSAEQLTANSEYQLYFTVGSDETKYALTEADGVTVSSEAATKLGLTQDYLSSWFTGKMTNGHGPVTVSKTSNTVYTASASGLPMQVASYTQKTEKKTDEATGETTDEPVFDANGDPVWDTPTMTSVTWYIAHRNCVNTASATGSSDRLDMDSRAKAYGGTYQVTDGAIYPSYVVAFEKESLQLLQEVTFNIVANVGNEDMSTADKWTANQKLQVKGGDSDLEYDVARFVAGSTDSEFDNDKLVVTIAEDQKSATYKVTWPSYEPGGKQLTYSITQTEPTTTSADGKYTDYKQIWYDNSGSSSHGSASDAVYSGGTLNVTRAGTTSFTANAAWLDDNNPSGRTATTYNLYRYSANGGSVSTAAQVMSGGQYVSVTISESDNKAATSAIDLGAKIAAAFPSLELPKYDQGGYPYYYFVRQTTQVAGYERVAAAVSEDSAGNVTETDTTPNYYDAKHKNTIEQSDWTRDASDSSAYNGGTITNRRTGTTTPTVTKTWEAASFQDRLSDVKVGFQLYRLLKDDVDESESASKGYYVPASGKSWEKVDGAAAELSDWSAEQPTQTASGSYATYDKMGREYVYQWFETSIQQGEATHTRTVSSTSEPGFGEFTLTFEGTAHTFTGTWQKSTADGAGVGDGAIYNEIEDVTAAHVIKKWQRVKDDDTVEEVSPSAGTTASVKLFQDGKLVGTFTMDGTTDGSATTVQSGLAGIVEDKTPTAQETSAWHLNFNNLPKYGEDGHEYSYLVLEVPVPGWNSSRSTTAKDENNDGTGHTTTIITNTQGPGEWTEIRVVKTWLDGGNVSERPDVQVQVVAKNDLYSKGVLDGTNTEPVVKQGDVIATVTLGTSNAYYAETGVEATYVKAESDYTGATQTGSDGTKYRTIDYAKDFSLVELSYDGYTVVSKEAAQNDQTTYGSLLAAWTNDKDRLVSTDGSGYVYEITTTDDAGSQLVDDARGALEITNRRLGLVSATAKKTWVDTDRPSTVSRPSANFVLTSSTGNVTFSVGEGGVIMAQATGGNMLPLYVDAELTTKLTTATASVSSDGKSLSFAVDAENNESSFTVYGLPKYDENGAIANYAFSEVYTSNQGDYQQVNESQSGTYGSSWHFADSISYSVTNKREATKDVTFYTNWYDAYVFEELNQRIDVYLTLYKQVRNADGTLATREVDGVTVPSLEKVTGYEGYDWETNSSSASNDPNYKQKATIRNLPKYDSWGREIVYYATSQTTVDVQATANLDYAPQFFTDENAQFAADGTTAASTEVTSAAFRVTGVIGTGGSTGTGGDRGNAVRESGSFNYRIEGEQTETGTKLWTNTPADFAEADLPKITIYLQRGYADGTYENGTWQKGSGTAWQPLSISKGTDGWYVVKTDTSAESPVADGQTVVAWTSDLKEVVGQKGRFTYSMSVYGENSSSTAATSATALPRYDANGHRYQYRAREVIDGLVSKTAEAGKVTVDQLVASSSSDSGLISLFSTNTAVTPSSESDSLSFTNAYSSGTGKLTVKKLYSGRASGDTGYPNTTFTLYRYYVKSDGSKSAATQVSSQTVESADVASDAASHTFENLEIRTPAGEYWVYYVVESGVSGYAGSVALGDVAAAGTFSAAGATGAAVTSPDLATVSDGSQPTATLVEDDEVVDVTFKNSYTPDETLTLTTSKSWNDYSNAFGLRPADITLTIKRKSGSGQEETLTTQATDASGENYLTATKSGDTWTYSIANIERWAPDGSKWTYTVSEGSVPTGYVATTSSASATAPASGTRFSTAALANRLPATVKVTKTWDDGNNSYELRPTSVKVQLQAKTSSGTWAEAGSVWNEAYGAATAGSRPATTQTLSARNNWTYTWTNLPTVLTSGDALEYRVVETKIGDTAVSASTDDNATYTGLVLSYSTSQTTSNSKVATGAVTYTTNVTNSLKNAKTSLFLKKAWDNDSSNAFNTRQTTTYYFQRSTDNGATWNWVLKYGETEAGTNLDNVVSKTIDAGDTGVVEFANLPAKDASGNAYIYRAVELKLPNYSVSGGTEVEGVTVNGAKLYAASSPTAATSSSSPQVYTNSLYTTSLSGTKSWQDFGSGLTPTSTSITFTAQARTGSGAWANVKKSNTDLTATPALASDTWGYKFEGLPRYDNNGTEYEYRAIENAKTSSDGFYPVYSDGATSPADTWYADKSTSSDTTAWTNKTVTNTATRFTLDKVGTLSSGSTGSINGVTLQLKKDGKVYAQWSRDASGAVSSTVWPAGTGDATTGGTTLTGSNAGSIIGLPSGSYDLCEVTVPSDYVKLETVGTVTIGSTGAVSASAASDATAQTVSVAAAAESGSSSIVKVTVSDPVVKGSLKLTKTLNNSSSNSALEDASFDLYRVGTGANGTDEKVVTGLTTNASGVIDTKSNNTAFVSGSSVAVYGRTKLSDGLLPGSYYFLETSTLYNAALPTGDAAKSSTLTIAANGGGKLEPATAEASMTNSAFAASVSLKKVESEPEHAAISDVHFSLSYTPAGSADGTEATVIGSNLVNGSTYTASFDGKNLTQASGTEGVLTFEGLKKGSYTLTETSNQGYEVKEGNAITFTVDDADNGKSLDLGTEAGRSALSAQATNATLSNNGLENTRLRGTITLTKQDADAAGLSGAAFKLQKKSGGDWADTGIEGLLSGKAYAANDANTSVDDSKTTAAAADGVLSLSNLAWGDYRLVETQPTAGYARGSEESAYTRTFTINRETFNATKNGIETASEAIANTKTAFTIKKTDTEGTPLEGTSFNVVASTDSGSFADGNTTKTLTTDADGIARLEGQTSGASLTGELVAGQSYRVVESEPTAGYFYPSTEEMTISVALDGTVSCEPAEDSGWSFTAAEGDTVATLTAADAQTTLTITKKSAADESPLAGASFTITPAEGSAFANGGTQALTFSTGEDGVARAANTEEGATLTGQLVVGDTYAIAETLPPAGYQQVEGTLYVTVQHDGTLRQAEGIESTADEGRYEFAGENELSFTGVVTNAPTELTIVKRDSTGNIPLVGATFTIAPAEGEEFADGTSEAKELTTDASGIARLAESTEGVSLSTLLVAGKSYTLTETAAPAGYELPEGDAASFTFTMAESGKTVVDSERGLFAASGTTVTVRNTPIELRISKVNEAGQGIGDASFTLTGSFYDGTGAVSDVSSKTIVVAADGSLTIDGTAANAVTGLVGDGKTTYTLTETKAPSGYELRAGALELVAEADGSIVAVSDVEGYSVKDRLVTVTDVAVKESPAQARKKAAGLAQTGDDSGFAYAAAAVLALGGMALVSGGLAIKHRRMRHS